jgi:hypothetical protein
MSSSSHPSSRPRPFEVILHAGPHKTGTTTIQSMLKARRDDLAAKGLYVPTTGQAWTGSHHVLINTLTRGDIEEFGVERLRAELANVEQDRVLISGEVAKSLIIAGLGGPLVDALRAAGAATIQILIYVRSPFALANASYCQRTGALVLKGATFDEFLPTLCAETYFDYDHFLRLAERDDVTLTVRPYSEAARKSVTRDFLSTLGVELELAEEERLNTTFGPIAIEALRRFAEEEGALEGYALHHFMHLMFRVGRSIPEPPFWGIDEAVERRLAEPDRKINAFAKAVWGKPWRDVIGEEKRPLNVFDPATAEASQLASLAQLQAHVRRAAAKAREGAAALAQAAP